MPAGPVQLQLTRAGLPLVSTSAPTTMLQVAPPTLKCIGEPYVDPRSSGCSRIVLDGSGFGTADDGALPLSLLRARRVADDGCGAALCVSPAPFVNVTFWNRDGSLSGQCDDVKSLTMNRLDCRVPACVPSACRVLAMCGCWRCVCACVCVDVPVQCESEGRVTSDTDGDCDGGCGDAVTRRQAIL